MSQPLRPSSGCCGSCSSCSKSVVGLTPGSAEQNLPLPQSVRFCPPVLTSLLLNTHFCDEHQTKIAVKIEFDCVSNANFLPGVLTLASFAR